MRKTQKKVLGFFGLVFVVAMTVFATMLPGPKASATTSITDTISVRVVGDTPVVSFENPLDGEYLSNPELNYTISNENVDKIEVYLTVGTPSYGSEYLIATFKNIDYDGITQTGTVNLADYSLYDGFGAYKLKAVGYGVDGVFNSDIISFYYIPTSLEVDYDRTSGEYVANLTYHVEQVCKVRLDLFKKSDLANSLWSTTVVRPETSADIPMAGLGTDDYVVTATSYECGEEGDTQIYQPVSSEFHYTDTETPATADTGGLFKNPNISNEDFLVTGLIVFFVIGIVAFGVVAKGRQNRHNKSRKTRR